MITATRTAVTPILMGTITITGMKTSTSMYTPTAAEEAHQHHLPGMVLLSFIFSLGAVVELAAKKRKRTR